MADLELRHNAGAFRYEAWEGSELVSQIDYFVDGDVLTITHTGTPPRHRHRGLASQLTGFTLDDLRASGRKVLPLCPFTASYIASHPQYQDLVARN
ncbi:MAG: GNAT family N-acetyltransferase [Acidobacteriota bacterium]|nr:GNAT family N-acetyltransferase [Acidobacteriota bacterium]NLH70815.1 N-acetyltransferase [Brooklawnia sp.]